MKTLGTFLTVVLAALVAVRLEKKHGKRIDAFLTRTKRKFVQEWKDYVKG
jgi:hypothetical protein